jgi:hypothetical protein
MAQTFLLDALDFAGDLMPLVHTESGEGPRFLNLYLLGGKGSGKTAFLQTLSSALAQTPPPTASTSADGSNDITAAATTTTTTTIPPTTELDRVNFAKLLEGAFGGNNAFFRRPFNVRVFDLWGA